jgi:adenylate kinase
VPQAAALDGILAERGGRVNSVLFIDVPDAPIVDRLVKRAALEGRADDTPETIRERLRVYREKTAPLADRYRKAGVLVTIDGHRLIDVVAADVRAAVEGARKGAG